MRLTATAQVWHSAGEHLPAAVAGLEKGIEKEKKHQNPPNDSSLHLFKRL